MTHSLPRPSNQSTPDGANTKPPETCGTCGSPVWRVRFEAGWLLVELGAGNVALTFPLIPGEPIIGRLAGHKTRLRLHRHAAFVSSTVGARKVRP
jgi:hypothetical protein